MVEDYIMFSVLGILFGLTVMSQLRLESIYKQMDVTNRITPLGPDFLVNFPKNMQAAFALLLLQGIGICAIKFNFLLFFRRLGGEITEYVVFW